MHLLVVTWLGDNDNPKTLVAFSSTKFVVESSSDDFFRPPFLALPRFLLPRRLGLRGIVSPLEPLKETRLPGGIGDQCMGLEISIPILLSVCVCQRFYYKGRRNTIPQGGQTETRPQFTLIDDRPQSHTYLQTFKAFVLPPG